MKQVFQRDDYDYQLMQEIYARTQGPDEKLEIYIANMGGLFDRL